MGVAPMVQEAPFKFEFEGYTWIQNTMHKGPLLNKCENILHKLN